MLLLVMKKYSEDTLACCSKQHSQNSRPTGRDMGNAHGYHALAPPGSLYWPLSVWRLVTKRFGMGQALKTVSLVTCNCLPQCPHSSALSKRLKRGFETRNGVIERQWQAQTTALIENLTVKGSISKKTRSWLVCPSRSLLEIGLKHTPELF